MNRRTRRTNARSSARRRLVATVVATAAGVASIVAPGTVAAQPTIPTATFDPTSTPWWSYRDKTSAEFGTVFDTRSKNGDMLIDLDVDQIGNDYRVGAIFRPNPDGRGWESRRDLTGDEFGARWTTNRDNGLRLAGFESYRVGNAQRYAGHWVENVENLRWASTRDRTSAQFSTQFDEFSADGLMPIDVDGYATSNGIRYASVWVENTEGLGWALRRDMTEAQWKQYYAEYGDKGMRVLTFESYRIDGQQRYAAIWVENRDGRGWYVYRDMDATGFRNRWNRMSDMGFRLDDYEKYDTANGPRYSGVWRQNGSRFDFSLRTEVDALVQAHVDQFDVPGMSVVVTRGGKVVYQRGFGYQDVDAGVWAHGGTVYRLASVSKAVSGVLALDVIGDHPSDSLDDKVRTHVPSLPAHHDYTIRQSLESRSCVESYPGDLSNMEYDHYDTATAALAAFEDEPLACTPGSYLYSTAGHTVACAALESITGDTIGELVDERITDGIGLRSFGLGNPGAPEASRLYDSDTNEVFDADDLTWKTCGGGLQSSVADMGRFGIRLLGEDVLSADELDELWDPNGSYALGWNVDTAASGERLVGKSGAQAGAKSYWLIYPDDDITITVLSNRWGGGHSASTVAEQIGELMLDEF
jgi:CubicO group peptidase (beta-lactamase class C family)